MNNYYSNFSLKSINDYWEHTSQLLIIQIQLNLGATE